MKRKQPPIPKPGTGKGVAIVDTLQVFHFEDSIRVSIVERNGQAWLLASEVCKALDIRNSRAALARLDAEDKGVATIDTPGGRQRVSIVNESGLYALIFTSRKESAKRFKRWVTSVVLPSVRQHGGYISRQEELSPEDRQETLSLITAEARRVGLCAIEEREARSEAFRLIRRR